MLLVLLWRLPRCIMRREWMRFRDVRRVRAPRRETRWWADAIFFAHNLPSYALLSHARRTHIVVELEELVVVFVDSAALLVHEEFEFSIIAHQYSVQFLKPEMCRAGCRRI